MSSPLAAHWTLDPKIDFLNHGSFGACLRVVLEEQVRLRDELERRPVEFLVRRLPDLFDRARAELAGFLGADPEGLVAVSNATSGVNTVLRSLRFASGDELLVTDHEYNASRNALDFAAEGSGARVVVVELPFPVSSPAQIRETILDAVTERTRLALIDHVTSPTGMLLPVEEIVAELSERGIDTLIDGAHAPGMLPLDLREVGSAYYTGNCHKWLCAPKGAAFLYVREDRRSRIRPLVISHGANSPRPGRSRFHDEFDWVGTGDPTAFLCVPYSIERIGALLPGGWPEVRERNRGLALEARTILADALGCPNSCPEEMVGSLAAFPLPDGAPEPPDSPLYSDPLQLDLVRNFAIEVPVIPWPAPPRRLLRISTQLYNDREQYVRLAAALRELFPS